jgi:hypothetical protein
MAPYEQITRALTADEIIPAVFIIHPANGNDANGLIYYI